MKNLIIFSSVLLWILLSSFTVGGLPKTFEEMLERGKMTFQQPEGYEKTKIIQNKQMNYEYAIKHTKENLEIRYAIRPLDSYLRDYDKWEKDTSEGKGILIHPNKWYKTSMQTTALNISGGQFPQIAEFEPEAVKQEFNADWGASAIVPLGQEFGQDYQFCMFVALHKDNCADAYCFILSDKRENFKKITEIEYYSLKFK
jgi:hypothetical protein